MPATDPPGASISATCFPFTENLSFLVAGDAATKKLKFSVNGKQVAELDAPGGSVAGIVGIRMNHNLDVHVDGFAVHKM
jgi:hypothetical protein